VPPSPSRPRPLALVYRGPASEAGCPEAVAGLLRASRWEFDVEYVGPREARQPTAEALAQAVLYAQPGGGELAHAYRILRRHVADIREYVSSGGRYLGFCLGGYLAGETPGFALLPGDSDRYIASPGASTTGVGDTVTTVRWRGAPRRVFFQDGPFFDLDPVRGRAHVLAVYDNGLPAAVVAPHGRGAVGVVGPHPEATPDWFTDAGLRPLEPDAADLGLDLLDELMRA
jgi:glutamine amidotransferase-like uncharacterized protein